MAAKTKKRCKKYRPRHVQVDPVSWAVAGVHNFTFATVDKTLAPVEQAIVLLKKGEAMREHWNIPCQALNIAEALTKEGVGANLLPAIQAGQQALMAIALRMIEKGGPTACYAAELAAIDEAVLMYRAQMSACTQAEFGRAMDRVKMLHRSGAMTDIGRMYLQMVSADEPEHA